MSENIHYLYLRDDETAEELKRRRNLRTWEEAVIPMVIKDSLERDDE